MALSIARLNITTLTCDIGRARDTLASIFWKIYCVHRLMRSVTRWPKRYDDCSVVKPDYVEAIKKLKDLV